MSTDYRRSTPSHAGQSNGGISMIIEVLVHTSHQLLMRSTLKNLFCFAVFKEYLSPGFSSMYIANSLLDRKWCGILPALLTSRK